MELKEVRVPLTNIQTPQYITIRLYVPTTNKRIASTVPFFNSLKFVGVAQGITSFSRDQSREVTKIYGFNGNEMYPAWVVPGKIDVRLRLKRVVFHETDFLQELGFIRGNLVTQENPFVIIEDQYKLSKVGGDALTTVLARSIVYHDCWLRNNNITYDIMANDMILVPEFEVDVGLVTTTEETASRLATEISMITGNWVKSLFSQK